MKYPAILCCVAVALPQLAAAEPPVGTRSLAKVDAIVQHCAKASAQAAQAGTDVVGAITAQTSAEELKAARESEEYRGAFEAARAHLAHIETDVAAGGCGELAANR